MLGSLKRKVAAWIVGRGVEAALDRTTVSDPDRKKILTTVKQVTRNVLNKTPTVRGEPVLLGGIIAIVVALAGAFAPTLELTTEELAITISTVIGIVSVVQRAFVSPTTRNHKGE